MSIGEQIFFWAGLFVLGVSLSQAARGFARKKQDEAMWLTIGLIACFFAFVAWLPV